MIRNNAATEMCITKGQEAIVYGWRSYKGQNDKCILDTLFVELFNPPTPIKLDGLPQNIVPSQGPLLQPTAGYQMTHQYL